jgi:hypothetical protein
MTFDGLAEHEVQLEERALAQVKPELVEVMLGVRGVTSSLSAIFSALVLREAASEKRPPAAVEALPP